jgi:hypothetical protein
VDLTIVRHQHWSLGVARDDDRSGFEINRQQVQRCGYLPMSKREEMVVRGAGHDTVAHAFLDQPHSLRGQQEAQRLRRLARSLAIDHDHGEAAPWPLDELHGVATLATGIFLGLRKANVDRYRPGH